MKIISWNVNSLRAREPIIEKIIKTEAPDIICLQELKILDKEYVENFFNQFSLKTVAETQKSYNGVSVSCKREIVLNETPLRKLNMTQARNNTVVIKDRNLVILNCYFPNGNPIDTDKFTNKLEWMKLLYREIEILKKEYEVLLMGDFNVIPTENDVYDHTRWTDDALFRIESKKKYRELCNLGFYDAHEFMNKGNVDFTHWDYQGGAWEKNHGIRIDHILLSGSACSMINNFRTHSQTRGLDKPSDHVPVLASFDINQAQ